MHMNPYLTTKLFRSATVLETSRSSQFTQPTLKIRRSSSIQAAAAGALRTHSRGPYVSQFYGSMREAFSERACVPLSGISRSSQFAQPMLKVQRASSVQAAAVGPAERDTAALRY